MTTKNLCLASVFAALVFIVTRFLQISIPLGYFNVGNCVILLFCYIMPCPYGILIGSIGSALADLTSFPEWTVPTLIIKALMPLLFYFISNIIRKGEFFKYIIAASISMLIPFAGYTFAGALMYGSLETGLLQIPGLAIEYAANLVLFSVLLVGAKKAGLRRLYEQPESQPSK